MSHENKQGLPKHIAIIMDGNGRWATKRFMPRIAGHKAGLQAAKSTIKHCIARGVEVLTLFAFSSENWRRPANEVGFLMDLFLNTLENETQRFHEQSVRVKFIGDRIRLDPRIIRKMQEAEELTKDNQKFVLMIAIDYGGQWDIQQAMQKILATAVRDGVIAGEVTKQHIEQALAFPELPAPDLLIRTSGEKRLSNFMLWQLAYSELYFTDILWPDFNEAALDAAIFDYMQRDRRYGEVATTTGRVD